MKTLVVLDGNWEWLSENLPDDVELDWQEQVSGVGGGLFDENGHEITNHYWEMFCNS